MQRAMAVYGIVIIVLLSNLAIVEANTRNDIVDTARHAIVQNADSSTKIKSGTVGNWNFLASVSERYKVLADKYTIKDSDGKTTSCYASLWSTLDDESGCYDVIGINPAGYGNDPTSFYNDVNKYGFYKFIGNNPEGKYPSNVKKDPVKDPIEFPHDPVGRFGQCKFAADLIISEAKKEIADKEHVTTSVDWHTMSRTKETDRNIQNTAPGDVIFAYTQTGDFDKNKNSIYGYVYLTVLKIINTDPNTGLVTELEARDRKANARTLTVNDQDGPKNLSNYSIAKYMRGIEHVKPADYIFTNHYVYGEVDHAAIVTEINLGDSEKGTVSSLDVVDSNHCNNYPGDYGRDCEVGKYHTIEWSKGTHPLSEYFIYTGTSYYNEPWIPDETQKSSITLSSPNGGEVWNTGESYTIDWTYAGNVGKTVKIEMINVCLCTPVYTIMDSISMGSKGKGSYAWKVPMDFWLPGTFGHYYMVVTSNEKSQYNDSSDSNFTISVGSTPPPPPPTGPVHNVNKNKDYTKIQDAINDASSEDKINVYSGTYRENVNVTRKLIIEGIDLGSGMPTIDGLKKDSVVRLYAGNVTFRNFTLVNASDWSAGIDVPSSGNQILYNTIKNNSYGINFGYNSRDNIVTKNMISNGTTGIQLGYFTRNNTFQKNDITDNEYSIYLMYTAKNVFDGNYIRSSHYGLYFFYGADYSTDNWIYRNKFIGNTNDTYILYPYPSANIWNSTTPITYAFNGKTYQSYLGNYWDKYAGADSDKDGIGDMPYAISDVSKEVDSYPLMNENIG